MDLSIKDAYVAGCIGRVVELHARFYKRLVDFGLPFEARVAAEMAAFFQRYEAGRDGVWLAVNGDEEIHGCVAIDASHLARGGAVHLRWFICSDATRGTGIGGQLLARAMAHCDAIAAPGVELWTFEGLGAARRLYERHGFCLVHQQTGAQWGREVMEQRFERRRVPP